MTLTLLNHIGILLILLLVCNFIELIKTNSKYKDATGASFLLFGLFEFIYWIIEIFFLNCFNL